MSTKYTVTHGLIWGDDEGQCYDAFDITIENDDEFEGVYIFDMSYSEQEAKEAIMCGAVSPEY